MLLALGISAAIEATAAVEAIVSDTLSLEDCQGLARRNNPRGYLAANAVQSAELASRELRASSLPQIKFKVTADYAPTAGSFGYDPIATNEGQLGAQFVTEQMLYDGGQARLKATRAGYALTRSGIERKRTEADLRLDVAMAFTDLLRLQEESGLKRQNLSRLRDYLALVERMHTGGQAGFTDVLKTRIQVSEAESAVKQGDADRRAAGLSLGELLGMAEAEDLAVKGPLDSAKAPAELDTAGNADWEIARLEMQGAELDAQAARAEWKPTLAATADAGLLTSVENLRQPYDQWNNMLGASVGMHLDLPVFAWGARKIHIRQSELAADSLKWAWMARRRNLFTDHRRTKLQWDAARERRDALRANLSAAADNYTLTKSKYAGGQGLTSEVLDAERLWADTHASLLQAQADLRVLSAKLERLEAH
jgi:outer membrane protein TolC